MSHGKLLFERRFRNIPQRPVEILPVLKGQLRTMLVDSQQERSYAREIFSLTQTIVAGQSIYERYYRDAIDDVKDID